jgi:hypothetical protein
LHDNADKTGVSWHSAIMGALTTKVVMIRARFAGFQTITTLG